MRSYSSICASCAANHTALTPTEISGITATLAHEIEVAECLPVSQLRAHWKILGQRVKAHLLLLDSKIAAQNRADQPTPQLARPAADP